MDKNLKSQGKIAVFDSGLGGLSILKELKKVLPRENFIYFADNKNFPYGEKSKKEIISLSLKAIEYLSKKEKIKALVIGCNTISCSAFDEIKKRFPFKVFEIISSNLKILEKKYITKKVLILATKATISSKIYSFKKLLKNPEIKIFSIAAPLLVKFVEEKNLKNTFSLKEISKLYIKKLEDKIDVIFLACTHFNFLKTSLEKIYFSKKIVNSSFFFAKEIKSFLTKENLLSYFKKEGTVFYASEDKIGFQKKMKKYLNMKI